MDDVSTVLGRMSRRRAGILGGTLLASVFAFVGIAEYGTRDRWRAAETELLNGKKIVVKCPSSETVVSVGLPDLPGDAPQRRLVLDGLKALTTGHSCSVSVEP